MTDWYDSASSADLVVRVGSAGAIETNPDPSDSGNTWTAQTSGISENLYGIAYNGSVFVAVGATGKGIVSSDAVTWVEVTTQSSEDLNSIATGGNVFIAVGNVGTMVQSQNGSVWTTITSGVTDDLWDIAIGDAVYVAVGDNDAVVTGTVVSTVLEVHLLETLLSSGALVDNGSFNEGLSDGLLFDNAESHTRDIADAYVYQFTHNRLTFGNDITHELNDADPQSGVDDSVTTLDTVVLDAVNMTSNDAMILGGAGTGEPRYIVVGDNMLVTQLGAFDMAKLNSSALDTAGISERLFDSFEKLQEIVNVTSATLAQYHKLIADVFEVDDVGSASVLMQLVISETAAMNDSQVVNGMFLAVLEDQITIDEELTANQIFELIVDENLSAFSGFTFQEEGSYIAVVMNTKNQAITEYQDYNFNSLAKIGKQYFGCKSDGIYLLDGTDDAGSAITAVVKSGQRKLSGMYSRVERAYLALRNDNSMVLKTIVRDKDGVKKERWYETANTSNTLREIRIKLAKGVKSHYWQWELVNKDGADFELDRLELKEIKLTRRI